MSIMERQRTEDREKHKRNCLSYWLSKYCKKKSKLMTYSDVGATAARLRASCE